MTGMIPQEIGMHPPILVLIHICITESTLRSVFVQFEFFRTVFYGEYKCTGEGANLANRVPYAQKLSDVQVLPYLNTSFIDGDQWLQPYCDSLISA